MIRGALVTLAILGWGLVPAVFGRDLAVAVALPAYALAISIVVLAADPAVRARLRPTQNNILIGLVLGAVMTASTYVAYALTLEVVPTLASVVEADHGPLDGIDPWAFAPRMLAVILAEELLFRGSALEIALPVRTRIVLSVAAYVLVQIALGSPVVMLLGLVCGTIWTLERHATGSLIAPLLTHAIWTPSVLLIWPIGK